MLFGMCYDVRKLPFTAYSKLRWTIAGTGRTIGKKEKNEGWLLTITGHS